MADAVAATPAPVPDATKTPAHPSDKYRKKQKPRETSPPDEIRVTGMGRISGYVAYGNKLLTDQGKQTITIRATGKAMSTAVCAAEVIKRRVPGLHQLTTVGSTEMIDEYEPLEEGLEVVEEMRTLVFISIVLTKDESSVDKALPGYQPPLDESQMNEIDPDSFRSRDNRWTRRSRGRGGGRYNNAAAGGQGQQGQQAAGPGQTGGGGGGGRGRGRRSGGGYRGRGRGTRDRPPRDQGQEGGEGSSPPPANDAPAS